MTELVSDPRFPQPKILLVDLPEGVMARLSQAGFNVHAGSFGRPYKVPMTDNFVPVMPQADLPNYTEQDVIILDLMSPDISDSPEGQKQVSDGEPDWYAKASRGIVDPRPRVMAWVSDHWHRILSAGGVFVVFAEPRERQQLVFATAKFGYFDPQRELNFDNWSFLPILSDENIRIDGDHGMESQLCPSVDFLDDFLRKHQADLSFSATLKPAFYMTHEGSDFKFVPLLKNKFGEVIGGIILAQQPNKGRVLILPRVKNKELAVYDLVTTVLPEISRHLFPFFEGDRWVHGDQYEHVTVLERRESQQRLMEEAKAKIAVLEKEIEQEQVRLGFLHGIITSTGDELVDDVEAVLKHIGFVKVERPAEESGTNKQEDLQLHDRSPTLLMEVKGIGGQPSEGDTLQGTKYVLRRIKEWNRTDVCGVFLVNHQRNLPALDRDHKNVFTAQQVADAVENGMGLMTTWDLFRLVRGMTDWAWAVNVVQDVFFGKGRLPSTPSHYSIAGKVAHFFDKKSVISIDVEAAVLRIGDTMGYLFADAFFEEKITSLQVDGQSVQEVKAGQRAGYKTTLKRKDVPEGTVVYIVSQATT